MILTDSAILQAIADGSIVIEPFNRECLGTNSYDVHLGKNLATYRERVLDAKAHNQIEHFEIPEEGYVLQPDINYLGITQEYTETHTTVPFLEGKSSVGRLGIDIHATAGKGDVGFCNHWTLEISVKQPVRVYAGMPIGQLIYFRVEGEAQTLYKDKESAKYNQRSDLPISRTALPAVRIELAGAGGPGGIAGLGPRIAGFLIGLEGRKALGGYSEKRIRPILFLRAWAKLRPLSVNSASD